MVVPESYAAATTAADKEKFEDYRKRLEEIGQRWRSFPALQGFPEEFMAQAAVALHNESVFLQEVQPHFAEAGLELTAKIMTDFVPFDMVSVQPKIDKQDPAFFAEFQYSREGLPEGGGKFNLQLRPRNTTLVVKTFQALGQFHGDETLEHWTDAPAADIKDEIVREIFTDLRTNAATVFAKNYAGNFEWEAVYRDLCETSSIIHHKTLRGGMNWLAMGTEMAKDLKLEPCATPIDWDALKHVTKVGTVGGKWKLIVDPLFPKNEILCGLQEKWLNGYVYMPYVMAAASPVTLDPESFAPKRRYITRYAKCLISPKPYARVICAR